MHNIRTNFRKFYGICKELFENQIDSRNNFRKYPVPPKMNDLQIVSLSCCMEALGIDSEKLLWSKIKTDYPNDFPNLIDRSRFNRRRKRLTTVIQSVQSLIAQRLEGLSDAMIIDSVPIPVVKLVRERSFKSFRKSFETAPAKGYSAVNKGWYIGYKLHVVIFGNGVVQQGGITKANVHDINYLKQIGSFPEGKNLLGDRAYISKTLQMDLFEQHHIKLRVPFRSNQYACKKHPRKYKAQRQMIETFFAQLCDQMNLKRNYAKSYAGLATRLTSKLSGVSILQFINQLNGQKLSKIKHALSF